MRGHFGLSVQQQLMASTAALVMMASASPAMAQTRTFDVPAQSAARSIPIFAKQAGVQIVASGNTMRSKRTNQVRGSYSVEEALRRLLEGTGLTATPAGSSGIITIQATASGEAQAGSAAATDESADIVVTGSNIKGAGPVGSQLTTIGRREIDQSGYSTTGQLIASVPQIRAVFDLGDSQAL